MRLRVVRRSSRALLAGSLACLAAVSVPLAIGQTPPAAMYTVGQSVEAREGDTWSKAKVIAREGRRVQIEYEDGTKEWVTADRLRAAGGAGAAAKPEAVKPEPTPAAPAEAAPAADEADAKTPAAKKPAPRRFGLNAAVEVKSGLSWKQATIKNTRGEWYLVNYPGTFAYLEWVEPWRIRTPGDAYDIDYTRTNPRLRDGKIDPPPRVTPGPPPAAAGEEQAAAVEWPVTDVNVGDGRDVAALAIAPWTYVPPADALPPGRITERPIALQGGASNDGAERTVALDVNGAAALLVYQSPFDPKQPVAEVVHLGTGQQIARAEFSLGTLPLTVAPDGKRVAGRGDDKGEVRVDVWDVVGKQSPKHVVSFTPYANAGDFFKKVDRVILLDATHLLTLNTFNQHAILWEIGPGSARAIWHAKLPSGVGVAASPDRKTLAIAGGGMLVLLGVADGASLGSIDLPPDATLTSLSFRADGRRLCALAGPTLYAFDLESGKQTAALGLPVPLTASEVHHLASDAVALQVAGGPIVFDVAQRAVLGKYKLEHAQHVESAADKFVAATKTPDKRRQLAAWSIPVKGRPATPLEIVPTGNGTKVTLDVQVEADDATRKAIVDALTKQIAARGWTIGEGGNVRVVARTETGRTEQREYGSGPSFGPFAGKRETVSVTERIAKLSVEVGGKPAWTQQQSSMAGFMVSRKEDQSIQEAVDAAGQYPLGFLKTARVPEVIFVPMEALPAGVPTFTLASGGVRAE